MRKKNKDVNVFQQIKFDEKTSEPIIVEVSEKDYLELNPEYNAEKIDSDFVKLKSDKGKRKQLAMQKVFGYKKEADISHRQKVFKTIVTLLFIVFMGGVLAYTAYNDFFASGKELATFEEIMDIFAHGWPFIICAVACLVLAYLFKGLKISIMCKSMTGKAHFKTSVETGIIGLYYNNVTPLAVGGQPFEIYHLSKHGVKGGVASSIPIATFFLNQFAFVVLGAIALILFNTNAFGTPAHIVGVFPPVFNVLAIIGLFCCIFMPSLVILFSMLPKVGAKMVHLIVSIGAKLKVVKNPEETITKTIKTVVHNSHCIKKLAKSPLVFTSTLLLSFLENLASVSIAYFSLKTFGYDVADANFFVEWVQVIQICFILFASITFIPTPGNSGAADLSFYLLFSAGITVAGLAFPAMITWRIISFYSTIIIGFLFASLKKKADVKRERLLASLEPVKAENVAESEVVETEVAENKVAETEVNE